MIDGLTDGLLALLDGLDTYGTCVWSLPPPPPAPHLFIHSSIDFVLPISYPLSAKMDGWVGGLMDGYEVGRMDGWVDGWT